MFSYGGLHVFTISILITGFLTILVQISTTVGGAVSAELIVDIMINRVSSLA